MCGCVRVAREVAFATSVICARAGPAFMEASFACSAICFSSSSAEPTVACARVGLSGGASWSSRTRLPMAAPWEGPSSSGGRTGAGERPEKVPVAALCAGTASGHYAKLKGGPMPHALLPG